jgi:SHS2 domain-containing protein
MDPGDGLAFERGHAVRPHMADVVIEAWGATAAACYEEAVAAFVDIFADTSDSPTGVVAAFDVGPGRPEDLLVLLLEEVLFDAEAKGHVATATRVELSGDHVVGTFTFVPAEEIDIIGSIPKGVAYHDLAFGPADAAWRCRATVDV